jgi:homoserine kinase type II
MGTKTLLSLHQLQQLFKSYHFTTIQATLWGVIDTTYIVSNTETSYILKKYERDIKQRISDDTQVLKTLHHSGLHVSKLLETNDEWYLYKKLDGTIPKTIKHYHVQALSRFMAKLHHITYKNDLPSSHHVITPLDIYLYLNAIKGTFYFYYKKCASLHFYHNRIDGFIHGDLFKDNALFKNEKLSVIDFIDSGKGSFLFDVAVTLVGFGIEKRISFVTQFINTYNQHAPQKISLHTLNPVIKVAKQYYALKRIYREGKTVRAKELLL